MSRARTNSDRSTRVAQQLLVSLLPSILLLPSTPALTAPLALADKPLFIRKGVDPNIFVTFDDSGSMGWAYLPDNNSVVGTRRFMSAAWNGQFYNPMIDYVPPKKADGSSYSTSFNKAFYNGFRPDTDGDGSQDYFDLANNYAVEKVYNPASKTSLTRYAQPELDYGSGGAVRPDTRLTADAAYYYLFEAGQCTGDGSLTDESCYKHVYVGSAAENDSRSQDDSRQNFANWYSFYRTRVFAASSAATLAFETVGPTVRLGFQALNDKCDGFDTNCRGWTNTTYDSRLRPFTGDHRAGLYKWLAEAPANDITPLRNAVARAGAELLRTDKTGAYAADPHVTKDPVHECRPSYHMMFTDGSWNGELSTSVGNVDNTVVTTPAGEFVSQTFSGQNPFSDNASDTVSDIVMKQWLTDAQPGVPNKVPTFMAVTNGTASENFWNPRNDSASWQHMTTFSVGLGFSPILNNPNFTGDTFGGDFPLLANGTKAWPAASKGNEKNPYDLWHAAINGRGLFFSADDPNALVEAFRVVLQGIQDRTATAAAPSANAATLTGLDFAYTASFNSQKWTGDLKAFPLVLEGRTVVPSETASWSAAAQLRNKDWASRNIKVASSSGTLIDFRYAGLTTAQQASLDRNISGNIDGLGSQRADWIRGNMSDEGSKFRERGAGSSRNTIGDIVYSAPVFVGAPALIGEFDKAEGFTSLSPESYQRFKTGAAATRRTMVYIGANDGMLHGFDAATGEERFAFIPSAVVGKLANLTSPSYGHTSFVDGKLETFDIYDRGTSVWRTILVGTLRNGGRSVFALDVTNPDSIGLLWEFTDADLGYVYGAPTIARLHNDRWGVIFGNGYNSDAQHSVLFVVDALNGSLLKKFDTGSGSSATPNGMAAPGAVDLNGDFITDYVYAGDLLGNLWRFDLLDAVASDRIAAITGNTATPARKNALAAFWSQAFNGNPLFVAVDDNGNRQSITTRPQLALHPLGDGYLVLFGTGRYLEDADALPGGARVNSFYSIWDRSLLDNGGINRNGTITRSLLQEQKLLKSRELTFTNTEDGTTTTLIRKARFMTTESVDWFTYDSTPPIDPPTPNERGWFFDMVEYDTDESGNPTGSPDELGEMLLADPEVKGGVDVQLVYFSTSTPKNSVCESGLGSNFFGLDVAGGPPSSRQFDLNADGVIDSDDYAESADDESTGRNTAVSLDIGDRGGAGGASVGDNVLLSRPEGIDSIRVSTGAAFGRQTWRELQ